MVLPLPADPRYSLARPEIFATNGLCLHKHRQFPKA